jgi:hypothetical protein
LRALVVFHSNSDHWLASLLKPGFAHCLVCILVERDGQGYWLSIDPAKGVPLINVECGPDGDLRGYYEALGCTVIETETCESHPPRWSWALANCVGVLKYVLGVRAPLVITPYQLFKRLKR